MGAFIVPAVLAGICLFLARYDVNRPRSKRKWALEVLLSAAVVPAVGFVMFVFAAIGARQTSPFVIVVESPWFISLPALLMILIPGLWAVWWSNRAASGIDKSGEGR